MNARRISLTTALVLAALIRCSPAEAATPGDDRLARATAALREANYAADAAAVARLRDELQGLARESAPGHRWLADYQAGFASSMLAGFVMPGSVANPQGDIPQALVHLRQAVASFEAAIADKPEFADAHAYRSSCLGMIGWFDRRAAEVMPEANAAMAKALALGPANPRVVLIDAGRSFWIPPQLGGDRARGMARYREALQLFAAEPAAERALHSWGEPDGWAFLAMAYLAHEPPDPRAAKEALDRAFALRPHFAWARQALLPQVEKALAGAPARQE